MTTKAIIKKLSYLAIVSTILLFVLYLTGNTNEKLAKILGRTAVAVFILMILPGTLQRLRVKGKLKQLKNILMSIRLELGILVFLLSGYHYIHLEKEKFGLIAMILMIPLFLTSSTWIRRKMKKWWQKLHNLTYIIIWLIVAHLVVVGKEKLAILLSIFGIIQVASLVINFLRKRRRKNKKKAIKA